MGQCKNTNSNKRRRTSSIQSSVPTNLARPDAGVNDNNHSREFHVDSLSSQIRESTAAGSEEFLSDVNEILLDVYAPPGKLGIVVVDRNTPKCGPSTVEIVRQASPLAKEVRVGDKLVAVDGEDVREMSAENVSELISEKRGNVCRKLTFIRTCDSHHDIRHLISAY